MNVWIGTAGYSYSNWVGPFYPPGLRTPGMLGHYASHFPVVDLPAVPGLSPRGPAWSGKRFCARLHSRNAGNWYGEGGIRYDYGYGDAELREWAAGLRAAAETCEEAYLVFNNCKTTQAVDNA